MTLKLIGFAGYAGSGKTTASEYLTDVIPHRFHRVKFAGPLKSMASAIGLTQRHIEGDLKEVPCALLCGHTPRYFMQRLGTEFGRDLIGEDFWTNLWKAQVREIIGCGGRVVVDDVRFTNELAAVREMGGEVYRIVRGSAPATDAGHASETQLQGLPEILNTGSINSLYDQIRALI